MTQSPPPTAVAPLLLPSFAPLLNPCWVRHAFSHLVASSSRRASKLTQCCVNVVPHPLGCWSWGCSLHTQGTRAAAWGERTRLRPKMLVTPPRHRRRWSREAGFLTAVVFFTFSRALFAITLTITVPRCSAQPLEPRQLSLCEHAAPPGSKLSTSPQHALLNPS